MEHPELANGSVIDDSAVGEDIIAVPIHPAKDVIAFEKRRASRERLEPSLRESK